MTSSHSSSPGPDTSALLSAAVTGARPTLGQEAVALAETMANDFDHLESILRPHEARAFTLRAWAAVRRQEELAAAQAAAAAEDQHDAFEAEMWATPAEIAARRAQLTREREAAQTKAKNVDVAAATAAALGDGDDEPETVTSYLKQDSSAIMNVRKAPMLRSCRRPPRITSDFGVTAFASAAPDIHLTTPEYEISGLESSVFCPGGAASALARSVPTSSGGPPKLARPLLNHHLADDSRADAEDDFPSQTPLLDNLKEITSGSRALRVDWRRRESVNADMPSVDPNMRLKRRSSTSTNTTVPPLRETLPAAGTPQPLPPLQQPKAKRIPLRKGSNFAGLRTTDALVITNHTEGLRGPMTLLHPITGVDRVNYDELYRDQFTAARDLMESDVGYMALMEHLDYHMASVKFNFNAMLDGKFMHDAKAKQAAMDSREKVLVRENRLQAAAGAAGTPAEGGDASNPLQRLARGTQLRK